MDSIRLLLVIVAVTFLSGCALTKATAPLATDDCGPKPQNPGSIVAAWANARCHFISSPPFSASEFIMSEPTKVAVHDLLRGRQVGWQIILGPENSRFVDFTEVAYTRFVINRDHVVSVVSSSFPF